MLSTKIAAAGKSAVIFRLDEYYILKIRFNKINRVIRRSIIYNNDFKIGIGAIIQRYQALRENIMPAVEPMPYGEKGSLQKMQRNSQLTLEGH